MTASSCSGLRKTLQAFRKRLPAVNHLDAGTEHPVIIDVGARQRSDTPRDIARTPTQGLLRGATVIDVRASRPGCR